MLGFFQTSILKNAILNASNNHIESYKNAIRRKFRESGKSQKEVDFKVVSEIRNQYLYDVMWAVFDTFAISSPGIFARLKLALTCPSICGYDISLENGVLAGSVYAMCYWAIKNKSAKSKDCIELNHKHNAIMEQALKELDEEFSHFVKTN